MSKIPNSESIKKCLRICSMPEWKKELLKSMINPSFNLFYKQLPCVNHLNIKTSLEEFGIQNTKSEKYSEHQYINIIVHYNPEFLSEIFFHCKSYQNLALKFLIRVRKINSISDINSDTVSVLFEKVR
jgi:hypothetical protein